MNGLPFMFPYLANQFAPDPGPQPYKPGQSYTVAKARQTTFTLRPWPAAVPCLLALASNPGVPRMRAPLPVVNNLSPIPANYLFIGGFTGKSRG